MMEGNLFYSKSTHLMLLSCLNTLTDTPRLRFDQLSGHYSPAKWTHKMNHHQCQMDTLTSLEDHRSPSIREYQVQVVSGKAVLPQV